VIDWPEKREDHSKMAYTDDQETADEGKRRQGGAPGIYLESTRAILPIKQPENFRTYGRWCPLGEGDRVRVLASHGYQDVWPRAVRGFEILFRK